MVSLDWFGEFKLAVENAYRDIREDLDKDLSEASEGMFPDGMSFEELTDIEERLKFLKKMIDNIFDELG